MSDAGSAAVLGLLLCTGLRAEEVLAPQCGRTQVGLEPEACVETVILSFGVPPFVGRVGFRPEAAVGHRVDGARSLIYESVIVGGAGPEREVVELVAEGEMADEILAVVVVLTDAVAGEDARLQADNVPGRIFRGPNDEHGAEIAFVGKEHRKDIGAFGGLAYR